MKTFVNRPMDKITQLPQLTKEPPKRVSQINVSSNNHNIIEISSKQYRVKKESIVFHKAPSAAPGKEAAFQEKVYLAAKRGSENGLLMNEKSQHAMVHRF
jgi:hypothetical protein